ncbi:MAG: rhodanese-like domain-containing protein [Bacteroidota bacterium]
MRRSIVMLAVGFLGIANLSGQEKKSTEYICPMYCTDDVATAPGARCPVCRMEFEDRAVVENPTDHKLIAPEKAHQLMQKDSNVVLLDVRSPGEFQTNGHLQGARLIPIQELERRVDELAAEKGKTIITYCSHGIRSARAARLLQSKGFTIYSLIGGTTKWTRDKLPVVRD